MKTIKRTFLLFSMSILSLLFTSCSKDDDNNGSSYPKQVSITYIVSSTTTASASLVIYQNETGGNTDVTNPTLPYTKTFTRTVNQYDLLSLGYGTNTNQTVKMEILVNNTLVKSQTFTSTSGAITYLFE
jgi:hypothetical protein